MNRLAKINRLGGFRKKLRGFVIFHFVACFLSVGAFSVKAMTVSPTSEDSTLERSSSDPSCHFTPMMIASPSFADSELAKLSKDSSDFHQTVLLAPSLIRCVEVLLQSKDATQANWAKEAASLLDAFLQNPNAATLSALRQWWEPQYRLTMDHEDSTEKSPEIRDQGTKKTTRRVWTLGGMRSITVASPIVSSSSSVALAGNTPPPNAKPFSEPQRELLDAMERRFAVWEGAVAGDERCIQLVPVLERFEWDLASASEKKLLESISAMCDSENVAVKERGERLAAVYLAPNFRAMVTVQLLQMLVPTRRLERNPLTLQTPGGTIQGASLTESELKVRLLPDENQARLLFEMTGDILSLTSAQRFGNFYAAATQSEFRAWKELQISESGNQILATQAEIRKNRFLPGNLRSIFPALPEIQPSPLPLSQLPLTRELNQTIQQDRNAMLAEACRFLDQEGERRIGTVRQRVEDRLLNPLTDMGLGPVVQSASSTDTQANFSLNIRTRQQCGAYTSAPTMNHSNALITLQAHESALNNLVEQIGLDGTTSSLFELQNRIAVRFNSPELLLAEADDGRFVVTFPAADSLRLQCRDGAFQLTLRIAELIDLDEGSIWKDLEVRAIYRIQMTPQRIRLVRTEPIQLLGRNIGGESQLRLRAIFGRIFSREGYSDILPSEIFSLETLRTLQCLSAHVENGWLTLELGAESKP